MAFKPGQSGNPSGRPTLPADIKSFKETTYHDFIRKLQEIGHFTVEELQEYVARKDITAFDRIFALVIAKAAQGDNVARQVLFDRLWGKVPDQLKLDQNNTTAPQIIISLPDNGRDKENVIDVK